MKVIDPRKRVTLISDVHLGDGSQLDLFRKKDREFIQFLDWAADRSDTIIVLGDGFDVLQSGNLQRIRLAHPLVIRKLEEIAHGRELIIVRGNHEVDADLREAVRGAVVTDRLRMGDDVLIEHGNLFDPFSNVCTLGRIHTMIEKLTGSFLRVPLEEYDSALNWMLYEFIHCATRTGSALKKVAEWLGFRRLARSLRFTVKYWGYTLMGDFHMLYDIIVRKLQKAKKLRVLILGHSHLPGDVRLGEKRYINTGSWVMKNGQYVYYDGSDFVVSDWFTKQTIRDERYRNLLKVTQSGVI